MQLKKLIQNYSNFISVFLLSVFSFFINYHYGFVGMMPMDNTVLFNGGYRVLKGYVPFSDYWLVTGPLLDYLNAIFFKFLGVSWNTFIIHSSLINSAIALASYFLFTNLKLTNLLSLFYSIQISILFYPVVGTPFVDHHSTFFLILSFYSFIFAINNSNYNFFFLIPPFMLLSFLSKQTPAVYGIISLFFLIIFYCFFDKANYKKILSNSIIGSVISIIILLLFFLITDISINNFFQQYIFFASSIGGERLSLYNFNLINEINNYKFIYFFIGLIGVLLIKIKIKKIFDSKIFLIISSSIVLSLILIFHQMITLNQNFIFFTIPFLCAIFHSFYNQKILSKYFLYFAILICIFSVSKYHIRFNEERKFNELGKVDISKAIDASILDNKLKGLKWITYLNPNNPEDELKNLREVLGILRDEKNKKIIITEYQIIAPILGIYDNSPNQWHHPSVSFPLKGNKYFTIYKKFFIENIKKNKIKFIYETREDNQTITELIISNECFYNKKDRLNKMLIKLEINYSCKDF
tara:strand:- start:235 stop:1806 length:1572 start_codon:yes stop_codon:yes gene_type:complete